MTNREREIFVEMGEIIGFAIEAIENRQYLTADSVIELDLLSHDETSPLLKTAQQTDSTLEISGNLPNTNEGHLVFVRITEGNAETVANTFELISGTRVSLINSCENGKVPLILWEVPENTLIDLLYKQGSFICCGSADNGAARFKVRVASEADVRSLLSRIQHRFPETRVKAKRELFRPADRKAPVSETAFGDLTNKQKQALETAYRGGYFSWPRESTAEDIAESLGISPPTLHAHLRKAEEALLAELFDETTAENISYCVKSVGYRR